MLYLLLNGIPKCDPKTGPNFGPKSGLNLLNCHPGMHLPVPGAAGGSGGPRGGDPDSKAEGWTVRGVLQGRVRHPEGGQANTRG